MMAKLRGMTKWIFYILIVAFLALMVFEWGADRTLLQPGQDTTVGMIGDTEISQQYFAQRFQRAYFNATGGQQNLTEQQQRMLRDQVWEGLIQEKIFGEQIEALDIQVTDDDIVNTFINNPPAEIRNAEMFQTNGVFDVELYKEALRTNASVPQLLLAEEQLREQLPFQKLNDLINASVIVTEQEIRDDFEASNFTASVEYLFVPSSSFREKIGEVSDNELQEYYNANKDDFKSVEKRNLNYIQLSALPTAEDSARIRTRAQKILDDLAAGSDFRLQSDQHTEDDVARTRGGDLGFFKRTDMVAPFSDAAFAADSGDVVGPVETRFGLHIIKVGGRKVENDEEMVQASHILLKFNASGATTDLAYNTASQFLETAKDDGFLSAADKLGVEMKQTQPFAESPSGLVPGIGNSKNIMIWAFDQSRGAFSKVTPVYDRSSGELASYVVAELADITPAGHQPFEDVKARCRRAVETEKRNALAREFADGLAAQVSGGTPFAQIAAGDATETVKSDTTASFKKFSSIPRIGLAPGINSAAFSLPVGEVAGPLKTNSGFYYIKVLERNEPDDTILETQRTSIRNRLYSQKVRNAATSWYTNLKEKTDIVDRRYNFFNL